MRSPAANPKMGLTWWSSSIHDRAFRRFFRLAAFFGLAFFLLSTGNAQMPTPQNGNRDRQQVPQQLPQIGIPSTMGRTGVFQERRIRQLNIERQKEIVSETNDLLKLTAQLNAEVAKNHSSSLTADQQRMVAKIEKLAKSVREKMSNPVQGSVFEDSFPPPMSQPGLP